MKRVIVFLYGVLAYVSFLGVFLYAVGFIGNIWVPTSLDTGEPGPIGTALLVNALLLGLFAVQHTIMARPAFKEIITRFIPKAAERSTFVLATNIILALMFWLWHPIGGTIWEVNNPVMKSVIQSIFWFGWVIVLVSTFLIDHFDLFGLRQVTNYLRGIEQHPPNFREHSLYKVIRHPIMLGFIIAFWAAPTMSAARLFFAVMCTGYILVGLRFEENDLMAHHGEKYKRYADRVPMLIPLMKFRRPKKASGPDLEDNPIAG